VAWQCFDVAVQHFEEILFDLKKKKNRKELIKPIEYSDVLVQYQ